MSWASWSREEDLLIITTLEVTRSWTNIIQQRTPCSVHKYVWEIRTLRPLKLGISWWAEEAGCGERQREPQGEPRAHYSSSRHNSRGDFGLQCIRLTSQRARGAEQHSGVGGLWTLWLTPVMGVEIQIYGRWHLAGAITGKRAKLQRNESTSYLSWLIAVGSVSGS